MTAEEFLVWLARVPPGDRDRALEERLGLEADPASASPPGDELIGYHAAGVAPILRALLEVPVGPEDVFVDLGAGLGKVVFLTALLTGASVRGVEIQADLVARARAGAQRLGMDVRFELGDAREASLDDATVFFLYLPFTGGTLAAVLDRIRSVAERRQVVLCALGIDLDRIDWLARRPIDEFWLTVYDSVFPEAAPRRGSTSPLVSVQAGLAAQIALGRASVA
jgi:SAM-dependent methyltransferase